MFHNLAYCRAQGKPRRTAGDGHRALKRTSDNQLAYREAGLAEDSAPDTQPSILLVHGWGVSGALFETQLEALSGGFRVVAPDLPGHGASAPVPPEAEFGWLADSLAMLIADLRMSEVCLVGWSLGAMVAWDLLSRYSDVPVRRLVTIDMVPRLLNDPAWSYGLRAGSDHHVFDRNIQWMLDD
jgi:pimeloyl-ACP methyl ester carboxylesterase